MEAPGLVAPRHGLAAGAQVEVEVLRCGGGAPRVRWSALGQRSAPVALPDELGDAPLRPYVKLSSPGDQANITQIPRRDAVLTFSHYR